MRSYEYAAGKEVFNRTLDKLVEGLFYRDMGINREVEFTKEELAKSSFIATYIAQSDDEEFREKAMMFGILSYLNFEGDDVEEKRFRIILYTILSRVGSIPGYYVVEENTSTSELFEFSNMVLAGEWELTRGFYSIDDESVLTEFQLDAWNDIHSSQFTAISGPTASGKSYVIQKYIQEHSGTNFQGVYIVPTRSLISEVTEELRDNIPADIPVINGGYIDEIEEQAYILVLTPERCLSLYDYEHDDDVNFDMIFMDEIQNLESDRRGVLFESVIENLYEIWPGAKFIWAGPFLDNPKEILNEIFLSPSEEVTSEIKPVFQLEAEFTFRKKKETKVELESPSGNTVTIEIPTTRGLTYNTVQNKPKVLAAAKVVEEYCSESQTLVFASGPTWAETCATRISEHVEYSNEHTERLDELIEFIRDNIHPDYKLARFLEKGIAYHHGKVPDIIREEIEDLYEEGVISVIVCTSTLLEGINLPAKKIVMVNPRVGNKYLSGFEYKNLVGRVGRTGRILYGSVLKIRNKNEEFFDNVTEQNKTVTSATDKAFEEGNLDKLVQNVDRENVNRIDDPGVKYTATLLRNKFAKNPGEVRTYLDTKGVQQEVQNEIVSKLEGKIRNLTIPKSILRKNPSIDPMSQNELFLAVKKDPHSWVISPNRLKNGLYNVTQGLNKIFEFARDSDQNIHHTNVETANNIKPVIETSSLWLNGATYKNLVDVRLRRNFDDDVDDAIGNVMELVSKDITHVVVKYYKLLGDVFVELYGKEHEFMNKFGLKLEMGSFDSTELMLMNRGVNRSVVIELSNHDDFHDVEDMEEVSQDLSEVSKRHLGRLGLLEVSE